MENVRSVRRAVAVEVESPPPELYAVEEAYRRIVEEARYTSQRGGGWRGRSTASCTAALGSCILIFPPSSSSRP